MSTFLRQQIVFGPIHSRRLGHSLGINLLPELGKICNFDCIYCECGWNKDGRNDHPFPRLDEVFKAMKEGFRAIAEGHIPVDTITFSGNGEPTLYPHFPEVIDEVIRLRDLYIPKAVVSVLSNATNIGKKEIREALMKVDNPILKVDSAEESLIRLVNGALPSYSLDRVLQNLKLFHGNFILQTMFLKGNYEGRWIDLSEENLAESWRKLVLELRPRLVMMYTIDRDTPAQGLEKVSGERMREIARPLIEAGIKIQIAE